MAERGMPERERREQELDRIERDTIDVGPGLGGGLAPVLPTDLDGENPDSHWMTTSNDNAVQPNWAHEEVVETGEPLEGVKEPLRVSRDTRIVTVFGEDLGRIEAVYGYEPTNDPTWAAVKDGDRNILVPVISAQVEEDELRVPYPKSLIEAAPDVSEPFSFKEEMALYNHYNERRILPATSGDEQDERRLLHSVRSAA